MSTYFFKRIIGAVLALAIVASIGLFAAKAQAEESQQELVFRNESPNCAWITLYGYNAGGIGGIFTAWNIIGGQARPRNVKAGETFVFKFRRTPRLDVRAEVYRNGCDHPLAADVRREQNNIRNLDILRAALKKSGNSFSISQPYGG